MDRIAEYNALAEQMLAHVEGNSTDQSSGVLELPASIYTDPARWAREMDALFKRLPLLVAFSAELPNPGDYKTLDIADVPLLVARGRDGVVRALLNVCAHRGAPVAASGQGNCKRFTCPYHGWTYANDGRLMGVSDRAKFGEIDVAARGLTELPCAERAGLIFACLRPGERMDIDTYLGGMLEELEHFGLERWHYHGRREIVGANWKVAYDGYLEGYHFATLHSTTLLPKTVPDVMQFKAYGPHLRIAFAGKNIDELRELPAAEWHTREGSCFRVVRTLFPNISISLSHGVGQIAQIIPGPTPGRNRTLLNYLCPHAPQNDAERDELEKSVQWIFDVTNNEDYAMGLKIQKNLESNALNTVLFGRNERGNQLFHRWVDYCIDPQSGAQPPTL